MRRSGTGKVYFLSPLRHGPQAQLPTVRQTCGAWLVELRLLRGKARWAGANHSLKKGGRKDPRCVGGGMAHPSYSIFRFLLFTCRMRAVCPDKVGAAGGTHAARADHLGRGPFGRPET